MPNPPDNTSGLKLLSRQTGTPAIDLASITLPLIILDHLNEDVARRVQALPLRVDHGNLFVAIADPNNSSGLDEIAFLSGKRIVPYAAQPDHLMQAIEEAYSWRRQGEVEWRGWKARSGHAALALKQAASRVAPVEAARSPLAGVRQAEPTPPTPPVRDPFAGENSYHPSSGSKTFPRQRPRILVVDDEPVIRTIVREALAQRGYEVLEAGSGVDALRLVKEKDPDGILLDALLPDVHGFDICKRLKASRRYSHIPIVMMTAVYKGWRMAADLKESYGVSGLIEKPFDLHHLVRTLENALTGKREPLDARELSAEAQRLFTEGQASYKHGDLDGAIAALSAAVAIDPLSGTLRHQLGLLYAQKEHDFAAIQELEMAVDLEPERYPVLRNLAVLYQRKGFRRKACELWERAHAQAPDDAARQEIKDILMQLL